MSNSAVNKRRLNALKNAAEALHEKDPVYKRDSDRRFIVSLIIVITLALSIRLFITEPTLVDGESMYPTLLNGERMLVEKVSLWFSEPQRGDIVICYYPGYTVSCVKRVIGLPGETVSIENGIIYINGKELEESAYWKYRGDRFGHGRGSSPRKQRLRGGRQPQQQQGQPRMGRGRDTV